MFKIGLFLCNFIIPFLIARSCSTNPENLKRTLVWEHLLYMYLQNCFEYCIFSTILMCNNLGSIWHWHKKHFVYIFKNVSSNCCLFINLKNFSPIFPPIIFVVQDFWKFQDFHRWCTIWLIGVLGSNKPRFGPKSCLTQFGWDPREVTCSTGGPIILVLYRVGKRQQSREHLKAMTKKLNRKKVRLKPQMRQL